MGTRPRGAQMPDARRGRAAGRATGIRRGPGVKRTTISDVPAREPARGHHQPRRRRRRQERAPHEAARAVGADDDVEASRRGPAVVRTRPAASTAITRSATWTAPGRDRAPQQPGVEGSRATAMPTGCVEPDLDRIAGAGIEPAAGRPARTGSGIVGGRGREQAQGLGRSARRRTASRAGWEASNTVDARPVAGEVARQRARPPGPAPTIADLHDGDLARGRARRRHHFLRRRRGRAHLAHHDARGQVREPRRLRQPGAGRSGRGRWSRSRCRRRPVTSKTSRAAVGMWRGRRPRLEERTCPARRA